MSVMQASPKDEAIPGSGRAPFAERLIYEAAESRRFVLFLGDGMIYRGIDTA